MELIVFLKLSITFLVGFVGGLIGILIGGCSLFTIPALIFLGLPPQSAIATNRVGIAGLMLTGGLAYHKKQLIDYKTGCIIAGTAVAGAVLGAQLVVKIDAVLLKRIIGILTVFLISTLIFFPKHGVAANEKTIRKKHYIIGAIVNFFLGIYGGFYGANVATFMIYTQILLFGKTFIESSATGTIAMFSFSVAASGIFMSHHIVHYGYATVLFVGMACGSYISAHNAEKIGNVWIRRLLIAMSGAAGIKLLFFHG